MDIIDRIFSRLGKDSAPWELRDKIFSALDQQPTPKKGFRLWFAIPAVAVLALVCVGAYYQYFRVANFAAAFELTPQSFDVAGITPNTSFILKSSVKLSDYQITKIVKFDPEVEFSVDNLGENQYRIRPKNNLNENQVYKISIAEGAGDRNYAWAYQVKAPFQVIGTIPGKNTSSAPINTGIEINFNREQFVDPQNFFQINPIVEGNFEQRGSVLIFIPKKPLTPGTIYTVTIKSGLKIKDSQDVLAQDYSFKFETQSPSSNTYSYLSLSSQFTQYLSGTIPTVQSYSYRVSPEDFKAVVYQFKNADEFSSHYLASRDWDLGWAYYYSNNLKPKIDSSMQKVMEFTPVLVKENYQERFDLPSALPDGFYFLVVEGKDDSEVQWFQMSPLAHYNAVSYEKTLLWIYDFQNNLPIQSAAVSLIGGGNIAQTDNQGLASFETPAQLQDNESGPSYYEKRPSLLKVVAENKNPYLVRVYDQDYYYSGSKVKAGKKYWEALTLDKPVYRPRDKVRFFGVIKPRNNSDFSGQIQIGIQNYDYSSYFDSDQTHMLVKTTVTPSVNGTYEGELNLPNLNPGYYELAAKAGEDVVSWASLEILDFSKPAYEITLRPSADYAFAGDNIEWKVQAKFFDGTPVSNLEVAYNYYFANNVTGILKLDVKGEGKIRIKTQESSSLRLEVSPNSAEEGNIKASATVPVYLSKVVLDAQAKKIGENNFDFKVKASKFDATAGGKSYWWQPAGDPLPSQTVYADVHKITYNRIETGQYYDYINKVFYPTYRYSQKDNIIEKLEHQTDSKGEWSFEKTFPNDGSMYYVSFYSFDDRHRKASHYPIYSYFYNYESQNDGELQLLINGSSETFSASVGDKLDLVVSMGEFKSKTIKTLFYKHQRSIDKASVVEGIAYKDVFENQDRPGVAYRAVLIGSHGFYETSARVEFKAHDAELKIQIDPERQNYKPGEEVKARIRVTDQDDHPLVVQLNTSVMDEALFHVLEYSDNEELLNQLYESVILQPMINYSRFAYRESGGGGGGGGGGEGPVRANFQDALLFQTAQTDKNGEAGISFKLPDNLTAWRITAQAFEPDSIMAGTEIKLINSMLPFFAEATLNDIYLVGDAPQVRVRVFGESFDPSAETTISARSQTLGLTFVQTLKSDNVYVELPKLTAGVHKIVFSVKQGDKIDSFERTIKVVESNVEVPATKNYKLSKNLKGIQGSADSTTKLLFVDQGRGMFMSELISLSYAWGSRMDYVLSRYFAQKTLFEEFGIGTKPDDPNLSVYVSSMGAKLLPYSDPDLTTTALSAALLPEKLPLNAMVSYFNSTLYDKAADVHRTAKALFGLAQYNQPVLDRLNVLIQDPNINLEDRLYIVSAMAALGDKEGARKLFNEQIKSEMTFSETQAWIKSGKDKTEQIKLSGLAGVVLAQIGDLENSAKVWNFLQQNYTLTDTSFFEKALMVKQGLKNNLSKDASFTYKTGSETKHIDLHDYYYGYGLELTGQGLNEIEFDDVKGDIEVISSYSTPGSAPARPNPEMTINRKYLVNGKETSNLHLGDRVLVNLTIKVNSNRNTSYEVTDYLPSGLKISTNTWGLDNVYYNFNECLGYSYPINIYENKVTFSAYKTYFSKCGNNTIEIRYYARVINSGIFKAEPALVSPTDDLAKISASAAATIEIKQ